ncbi:uncharacterized protein LOC118436590 [Folsomia candida]|uniref:uncharacterized protein LOC118436590 n=1 Tax=Folsomia candida TaxID=158441 RepID=UPI0016051DC2|nr:uncharacterized protein LOC118436590 [Folsomia candida]
MSFSSSSSSPGSQNWDRSPSSDASSSLSLQIARMTLEGSDSVFLRGDSVTSSPARHSGSPGSLPPNDGSPLHSRSGSIVSAQSAPFSPLRSNVLAGSGNVSGMGPWIPSSPQHVSQITVGPNSVFWRTGSATAAASPARHNGSPGSLPPPNGSPGSVSSASSFSPDRRNVLAASYGDVMPPTPPQSSPSYTTQWTRQAALVHVSRHPDDKFCPETEARVRAGLTRHRLLYFFHVPYILMQYRYYKTMSRYYADFFIGFCDLLHAIEICPDCARLFS